MRLTSKWPFIALLLGVGCAALQARDQLANARGTPVIAVDHVRFDGASLNGRLLISSRDGGYVVVRRNLREFSNISVDDVRDCDGGRTIDYIQLDGVSFPPKPEELLSIEPGYWFGYEFSLYIYDGHRAENAPVPACVQVDLGVHLEAAASGDASVQLSVRAALSRDDAAEDGGRAVDAGVP